MGLYSQIILLKLAGNNEGKLCFNFVILFEKDQKFFRLKIFAQKTLAIFLPPPPPAKIY